MPEPRPSDLAARMRGAAATTPPPAAAPRPEPAPRPRPAPRRPAKAAKGYRAKFTMLLDDSDADALEDVARRLRRQLGRHVDRAELLRELVRLARRDAALLEQLADRLAAHR